MGFAVDAPCFNFAAFTEMFPFTVLPKFRVLILFLIIFFSFKTVTTSVSLNGSLEPQFAELGPYVNASIVYNGFC